MGMYGPRYLLPPLDLLHSFEAAARNLSFTKAAAELALTQSAVSRQIQQLEERLGMPLFERRTRALLLTREGQLLLQAVEDALGRLDSVTRSLRRSQHVRTLTLATTPGFASLWLIPRLAKFTDANPGIDVRTSASNQLLDLSRAGVDLAVRFCAARDSAGGQQLFGGEAMIVCSPRLLAQADPPLETPEDLRRFAMLYLDDPHTTWLDWSLWFHALGLRAFEPARRLHYSHYDQMIQAAVNGQGIALGLVPLVRQLLRDGKLVTPFPNAIAPARAWYLLRSAESVGRPEVDAFEQWLTAEVEMDAARSITPRVIESAPAPPHRRAASKRAR